MEKGIIYFAWSLGIFALTVVLSIAVVATILVLLPPTFFLDTHNRDWWVDCHPVMRVAGRAAKNVLGIAVVVAGILLSIPGVPGQGLLTILVGLILIDVPGKRRWERQLLTYPRINRTVTRLRTKFARPPFQLDDVRPGQRARGA